VVIEIVEKRAEEDRLTVSGEANDAENDGVNALLTAVVVNIKWRESIILTYPATVVLLRGGRNFFGAIWADHLRFLLCLR
jgi:hypothetical protein